MDNIKISCPLCGQETIVELSDEASICTKCGKPFVTQKAVSQYINSIQNNINKQNEENNAISTMPSQKTLQTKTQSSAPSIFSFTLNTKTVMNILLSFCSLLSLLFLCLSKVGDWVYYSGYGTIEYAIGVFDVADFRKVLAILAVCLLSFMLISCCLSMFIKNKYLEDTANALSFLACALTLVSTIMNITYRVSYANAFSILSMVFAALIIIFLFVKVYINFRNKMKTN